MTTLLANLRHALRALARRPGFAAAAVLTLALGLGGSSVIFAFVDAVLLRPLPYREPDRLVRVTNVIPRFHAELAGSGDYVDWRERNRSLQAIAAFSDGARVTLTGRGEPHRLRAARVTASFLPTLGIAPEWGRGFLSEEDRPDGPKAVVLTQRLWQRLFAGVAAGAERRVELDGASYDVVGVLSTRFAFPGQPDVELLLPLALDEASDRLRQRQKIVTVVGRLQPGVSVEQAREELKDIQTTANAEAPGAPRDAMVITGTAPDLAPRGPTEGAPVAAPATGPGVDRAVPAPAPARPAIEMILKVVPLQQALVAHVRPALLLFSVAVGLVLIVACANVANLLLGRVVARQQELAVRAAIGASRGHLVRLLLTESALVALLGGALGVLLASAASRILLALMPPGLAASFESAGGVAFDGRVAAFALALSLVTSLAAGLAPALLASRSNPGDRLRGASPGSSPGAGRKRLRGVLVGAEVALAFVLLAGTGLLVRSFLRLTEVDPGFEADPVLTVALMLDKAGLDDARHSTAAASAFFEALLERVRGLPGVVSAAAGDSLPLRPFSAMTIGLEAEGQPRAPAGQGPDLALCAVTDDYFRVMGITLVRGRAFGPEDRAGSSRVAVVNETLARRLWGPSDPLGKRFRFGPERDPWITVVGVVADVRHEDLEREPRAAAYRPFAQEGRGFAFVAVRSRSDPALLVSSLRREAAALDPTLAVEEVATMRQRLHDAVAPRRFNALLLSAFGVSALVLAAVGLYGAVACGVTERTREMGIRIAIGATPAQVRALVMREGLVAAVAGGLAGGVAAVLASGALRGLLYGVAPTDPATFAAVPVLLLGICALASELPARRATRVDPVAALRAE